VSESSGHRTRQETPSTVLTASGGPKAGLWGAIVAIEVASEAEQLKVGTLGPGCTYRMPSRFD